MISPCVKYRSIIVWGLLLFLGLAVDYAQARVKGQCGNCHTMHNSQSSSGMAHVGTVGASRAGWDNESTMVGGNDSIPQGNLLVSDCVGCHSSSTSDTIITIGATKIPIVYNFNTVPTNILAGGNFYWVENGGDQYGHNVYGISGNDSVHDFAPGDPSGGCFGNNNSCHDSLALSDAETYQTGTSDFKNGCQGCHGSVRHHGNDSATLTNAEGGWFRFLATQDDHDLPRGVLGIEDPNWEQSADNDTHNTYLARGQLKNVFDNDSQSISKFCAGCHQDFHAPTYRNGETALGQSLYDSDWDNQGPDSGGSGNPWLRHPSDALIPDNSEEEYKNYTEYNPLVPVGRPEDNLSGFNLDEVRPGTDMVICLSCHRAHGSPYPDMLRWDYQNDCNAGTVNSDCGCFVCHSAKDE